MLSDSRAPHAPTSQNRLLAALPPRDLERMLGSSEIVGLDRWQVLHRAEQPISHVYFPTDCLISLIAPTEPKEQIVEAGLIGREGLVGSAVFLGVESVPFTALCQIPGGAHRVEAEVLRGHAAGGLVLHALLRSYSQALTNQMVLCAGCNRLHALTERGARWLLMTHDRIGLDRFPLPREFLALMLGSGRSGVNATLAALGRSGGLAYRSGVVEILDRAALEQAACPCYRLIAADEAKLLA